MPRELRPLVRALSLRRHDVAGRPAWHGPALLAVAVGVGPERAGTSAAAVLDALAVRFVVVTGVAGALDPSLRVGDLVVPEAVLDARSGTRFRPHQAPGREPVPPARRGTLRTVVRVDAATGAPLDDGALAVDMETAAIAHQCEQRGVPWDVCRAVSDRPGTLSAAVGAALRPDGTVAYGALVAAVVRQPAEIVALAKLGRGAGRAIRAATRATQEVLRTLGADQQG